MKEEGVMTWKASHIYTTTRRAHACSGSILKRSWSVLVVSCLRRCRSTYLRRLNFSCRGQTVGEWLRVERSPGGHWCASHPLSTCKLTRCGSGE